MAKRRKGSHKAGRGKDRAASDRMARTLSEAFDRMNGDVEVCGKRRYPSKNQAVQAIARTLTYDRPGYGGIDGRDGAHRFGVYKCGTCPPPLNWHCGHQPGQAR